MTHIAIDIEFPDLMPAKKLPAHPPEGETPQPFVNYDPILRDMERLRERSRQQHRHVHHGD